MRHQLIKPILAILFLFIVLNNFLFAPANIFSWDVFGYYLYLPFTFIYHDLGLKDFSVVDGILDKYHNTSTFYQAIAMPEGHYVMKYSMGMSFFYAPFFFIGHVVARVSGFPADGFSLPYQYAILTGGILYTLLGIWALSSLLVRLFSRGISVFVVIIIIFSTNYLLHVTMYGQNAMTHSYLFMTYALILWLTMLWHESHKLQHAVLLGLVCGLTILSRPSEMVCLIIPALWGVTGIASAREKIRLVSRHKKQLILFALILFSLGLIQMAYWKIYTGKFLFYSYGGNAGEGFEFLRPYLFNVLFSFRKGWLVYTPVMLFALAGFYFMYKNNRRVFYALLVYFILNLYVVSSWSSWWYAQSFSQRALIPSYPVMAVGLGYFLTWLKGQGRWKALGYGLIACCILLNIFQTIQAHLGVIDGDSMTKAYYFRVFGKLHATEEDKKLLLFKRSIYGSMGFTNEHEYTSKEFARLDFEDAERKDSTLYHSGNYSFRLDSTCIFSPGVEAPYHDLTGGDHAWIRISAYVYPTKDAGTDPFSLVVHFMHRSSPYNYLTYDSDKMNLEVNTWNRITFDYLTPEVRRKNDRLKLYFWHRGKAPVFLDDVQVIIFEKKPLP